MFIATDAERVCGPLRTTPEPAIYALNGCLQSAVISSALSIWTAGLRVCVKDMSSTLVPADDRETKGMQRRGNVSGCVEDALEITRLRRSSRASSATSMTPQTPLEIGAVGGHSHNLLARHEE
jgi:hypothetical protein